MMILQYKTKQSHNEVRTGLTHIVCDTIQTTKLLLLKNLQNIQQRSSVKSPYFFTDFENAFTIMLSVMKSNAWAYYY